MTTLLVMLPYYLLGNFHCLGMCGPLVMMLGKHRYRHLYFLGRVTSYTLAALAAGSFGAVLGSALQRFHLSATVSLLFGAGILFFAFWGDKLTALKLPPSTQKKLTALMLQDRPLPTYLFGFCTVFLPCGQTLVVFSYCALTASAFDGALNGFVFALATSPALWLALRTSGLIRRLGDRAHLATTALAAFVGTLALLRGFAELDLIPHLVINSKYHLVMF